MIPSFRQSLNVRAVEGLVVVGRFSGAKESLAVGTTSGKILLFDAGDSSQEPIFLSINKKIVALTTWPQPEADHDLLLICTEESVRLHSVFENRDVFYIEINEGVTGAAIGKAGGQLLLVVGTTGSLFVYDASGEEQGWTVTPSPVTTLAFMPQPIGTTTGAAALQEASKKTIQMVNDGILLVGCDDGEVYSFILDADGMLSEDESYSLGFSTAVIIPLPATAEPLLLVAGTNDAFALVTLGDMSGRSRTLWTKRVRSTIVGFGLFDLALSGVSLVYILTAPGDLMFAGLKDGKVVLETTIDERSKACAGCGTLTVGSISSLCVITSAGRLVGYHASARNTRLLSVEARAAVSGQLSQKDELEVLQGRISAKEKELRDAKAMLDSLQTNFNALKTERDDGIVATDLEVELELIKDIGSGRLGISISLSDESVFITDVVLFSRKLFESMSVYCPIDPFEGEPSKKQVFFTQSSPIGGDLTVDVYVKRSPQLSTAHVFRRSLTIPPFCFLASTLYTDYRAPRGKVAFVMKERMSRVLLWALEVFGEKPLQFLSSNTSLGTDLHELSFAGNALQKLGVHWVAMAFVNLNQVAKYQDVPDSSLETTLDYSQLYQAEDFASNLVSLAVEVFDLDAMPQSQLGQKHPRIRAYQALLDGSDSGTMVVFHSNDIELTQHLLRFLKNACPGADIGVPMFRFPIELDLLKNLSEEVVRLDQERQQQTFSASDITAEIKETVLRIENEKVTRDFEGILGHLDQLMTTQHLLAGHAQDRLQVHSRLVTALKALNSRVLEISSLLPAADKNLVVKTMRKMISQNKILKVPSLIESISAFIPTSQTGSRAPSPSGETPR